MAAAARSAFHFVRADIESYSSLVIYAMARNWKRAQTAVYNGQKHTYTYRPTELSV